LIFSNITYNTGARSVFKGKISTGFIYTMNVPDEYIKQVNYGSIFNHNKQSLQALNGTSEFLLSTDTYQFSDYSKYDASKFDEKHKAQVKKERYPIDCRKAFDLGAKLATI
jgi:hypothetical protein